MSFFAWIILGLISGFIGSQLINKSGGGIALDVILGTVGAVVGGYLSSGGYLRGLNIQSLFFAVVGSIIVLFIYHRVRKTRTRI